MAATDQYGNTADTLAAIYGGSASDYSSDMVDAPSPTVAAGSSGSGNGGWSSIFGSLLGAAGTAYGSTVAANTAAGQQNTAKQIAALNANTANNSSATLMKFVPWLIVGAVALLVGAFLLKRSRG